MPRSNTLSEPQPEEEKIDKEIISPMLHSAEPTYCICSQVSFGEMIACDNENCSIEWFHYKVFLLRNKNSVLDSMGLLKGNGIVQSVKRLIQNNFFKFVHNFRLKIKS